ncbi:hypothetical protein QYF36_016011 [Acer negundo]|nr:hypothetical protein QYF36_016011 [Acer negundo]
MLVFCSLMVEAVPVYGPRILTLVFQHMSRDTLLFVFFLNLKGLSKRRRKISPQSNGDQNPTPDRSVSGQPLGVERISPPEEPEPKFDLHYLPFSFQPPDPSPSPTKRRRFALQTRFSSGLLVPVWTSVSRVLLARRTFQPSTIRRKRNHGFFARKATKGGRRVIARRIAKGRSRITA